MPEPTSQELLNRMNDSVDALQAATEAITGGMDTLGNAVHRTGAETITGAKTFTESPLVPTAIKGDSSTKAASTKFVADGLATKADKTALDAGLAGKVNKAGDVMTGGLGFETGLDISAGQTSSDITVYLRNH